ncbi:cytochrome P450 [Oryctes borbonicus]|uniref:Cytochrome P450 n=1 Tax=Oryctes borbonicus TaxID=1629725 RepID=A0A0T6B0J9_9SCAR|nr:cytochrome P450 [Oryctes borbonicus]
MLIVPLLVFLALWYLVICWKWKKNFFDPMEKIPGDRYYPIFGTTYGFIGVPRSEVFYKIVDTVSKYSPLFRTWNGRHPEINIMKPEHLQVILRSSVHLGKGIFYENLFEWLGEGLLISKGAKWFMQRKLVTPAFHFKILENFMEVFTEKANSLVEDLSVKVDGNYFDVLPMVTNTTLEVICETAMGLPTSAITKNSEAYAQAVRDMTEMAMWRSIRPHFRWHPMFYIHPQGRKFRKILKELHDFSSNVIAERKKRKDAVGNQNPPEQKKRLSFLDLVLQTAEDPNLISDKNLRDLVDTFLFAGFDTTTNSTCWSIFCMGSHPEVQEKVFEEVRSVLGDKPQPTTMEELNQLKYMECVIKEALRLFPVLGVITRVLDSDIELDGHRIPRGTQAILHIGMVHRDPEHFPEPNKFIPERFLPENSKTRHPFAYIPFSAGPRNCIGNSLRIILSNIALLYWQFVLGQRFALTEEKTILASIINKYRITSMLKLDEMRLLPHTLIRPQDGIKIKIERREY